MIWVMLGLLLATMLIGIPILLCIALIGFIGIAAEPGVVMPMFAQKSFAQLDSYTLLALPFFILAGALMTAGGMSQQLVDFSRVLVGHLRAGLAHASVVCAMILSGVSGSSTADASAIASVLIPTMKKNGYKAGFAAALIACAGTIGAIIPPSMTMVVYGAIAQVSIGGLFLGGILPGLLVGLLPDGGGEDLHLPPRLPGAAGSAWVVRVWKSTFIIERRMAGAARAAGHRRRHPRRHLHRDRGRSGRLPLWLPGRLFLLPQDQAARPEGHLHRGRDHHHHGVGGDRHLRGDGLAARLHAVQRHGDRVGDDRFAEPVSWCWSSSRW